VVSVALDTEGIEAAGVWLQRARVTHPALIDQAHLLDELLGIVNVPSGVWIDEGGMIVRPPEPAFPWHPRRPSDELVAQLPTLILEQLRESERIRIEPEAYVAALRDWVRQGERSRFALTEEQLIARSGRRGEGPSRAAAAFELGQHLQRTGHPADAVRWFREAHREQPGNWTYMRQAWSLADPLQGPTKAYDSDWLTEVRRRGPESYYPALEL
jgi:hypothetical protein